MHRRWWVVWLAVVGWTWCVTDLMPAMAEPNLGGQAGVLESLPPDALAKIQALAELLQQSIRNGQLSDAQIQRRFQEGHLEETIRGLGPEADRLFEDLATALRSRSSEEALSDMLRALAPPP